MKRIRKKKKRKKKWLVTVEKMKRRERYPVAKLCVV